MPLYTTKREADRLRKNLAGGLPFPTPEGRKQPARPLRERASALAVAQAKAETWHQQQSVRWLRDWARLCPEFLRTFHVPNEHDAHDAIRKVDPATGRVYYSSASGARRKAEGVKPGMLDFYNLARSPLGYSALAVDLKVRGHELRNEPEKEWDQVREVAFLRSQNKSAHAAWSWAEVAALHAWYFCVRHGELLRSVGRLDLWLIARGGHDRRCGCAQVNLESFLKGA